MSRTALTIIRFTLIATVILLAPAATAQLGIPPQSKPTAPADTTTAAPPPAAIAVSDVPKRAEETSAALREIRSKTGAESEIREINKELLRISGEIEVRSSRVDSLPFESLSFDGLSDERQWWERVRARLASWQPKLQKRSQDLVSARDNIRDYRTVWELTRASARETGAPDAISDRIIVVLAKIDTVGALVATRTDTVLTLQNQVSQELVSIDETLSRLTETQSHVQRMLFAADSPPLWALIFAQPDSVGLQRSARATLQGNWAELRQYALHFSSRFADQLIAFLLTLLVLIGLARQARHWSVEGDRDLEVAVSILKSPIAVALLLVLIWPDLFHPKAPSSLVQLMQLLLLYPLFRLVASGIAVAKKPVYLIAVLFAFGQILHLVPEQSGLQRLLEIALAGLSAAGLLWLIRTADQARIPKGWLDVAVLVGRFAILLLGISIVANVFGYSSLANQLFSATMASGYWAILLTATYRVAKAVLAAILQTNTARSLRGIRLHTPLIRGKAYLLLRWGGVLIWIWAALQLFDVWDAVWKNLTSFLQREWVFGTASISIGDVLVFFFAIWLSVQVSKFVSFVLSEDVLPHLKLPRGVPIAITRVSGMLIVGFGFVLAAAAAGIDLNQFTLLAGALGVGIGFGMQNIVNNFISGLILIFERPISAGDLIQYGDMWGTVQRIGFRSSTIRTFSGADVIVPNGNLISTEVTNWSRSDQLRRVEVKIGVAYGTNPDTVIKLLEATMRQHADVMKEPEPYAVFNGFGESSLDFEIRGWTTLDAWLRVTTEIRIRVNKALIEAGIQIPFPQRDLHLRTVDPEAEDALAGRRKQPPPPKETLPPKTEEGISAPRAHTHDQDLDVDS